VLIGSLALVIAAIAGVAVVLMSSGGHSTADRAKSASVVGTSTLHPSSASHANAVGATTGTGQSAVPAHRRAAQIGGQGGTVAAHSKTVTPAAATVSPGKAVAVAEVRDPEEAKSFPVPASIHHRAASTPSVAAEAAVAPGAASDAQVRKELGEEEHAKAQERAARHRILTPVAGGFSVGGNGTIPIPSGVPEAVQRVVAGGNAIADFPYIWGGGHGSFVANGYDCSGSVSYTLAAGGLLSQPLVSGDLANWGEPGPGRWITIYANAGHTFMDVNGVWFDTAGRSGPYASRWLVSTPSLTGYAVRHPPGL
jgi:cell wall-associated NlpC family hydrolase